MDDFTSYFFWLLAIIAIFVVVRICLTHICRRMAANEPQQTGVRRRVVQRIRIDPSTATTTSTTTMAAVSDRQGNVLTIHDEVSRERRYDDIFFIEPNSVEAARIRAQLEKDDKDLPSYEEVIRMANLAQPTAAPVSSASTLAASNASVNTTDTILSVPPYSEVDPFASTSSLTAATSATDDATASSATTNANSAVVIALPITTPSGTQTSSNV